MNHLSFQLPDIDGSLLYVAGVSKLSLRKIVLSFAGFGMLMATVFFTFAFGPLDWGTLFLLLTFFWLPTIIIFKHLLTPHDMGVIEEGFYFTHTRMLGGKELLYFDWENVASTIIKIHREYGYVAGAGAGGGRVPRIYISIKTRISALKYQEQLIPVGLFKEFSNDKNLARALILCLSLHHPRISFDVKVLNYLGLEKDLGLHLKIEGVPLEEQRKLENSCQRVSYRVTT